MIAPLLAIALYAAFAGGTWCLLLDDAAANLAAWKRALMAALWPLTLLVTIAIVVEQGV